MEGDRTPKLLLQGEYAEFQPQISPDGRWLAYVSNESGDGVYVRPFPDVDSGRWPVSTSGGDYPLWSPDGRELFYRSGDSVIAVEVETEPAFKLGKTTVLFKGTYSYGSGLVGFPNTPWDVHPDGKRFLMLKPAGLTDEESEAGIPRKINIVVNWFEELKERLPAE
jgi:hypothetical protein